MLPHPEGTFANMHSMRRVSRGIAPGGTYDSYGLRGLISDFW